MECKYLSYVLKALIPVYRGHGSLDIKELKSLNRGDLANTFCFSMESHWGTHIDCPAHFFKNGKSVVDYEADFWLFRNPQVLTVKAVPGQIIRKDDLSGRIDPQTDILLFKSGWGKFRDTEIYIVENPGLDPSMGHWLREEYPSIRAIGLDWISLSAYTNRELGRAAHRSFLSPDEDGHPILIIEDMLLPNEMERLREVWVVPLRVDCIDSSPCTVIGVFE